MKHAFFIQRRLAFAVALFAVVPCLWAATGDAERSPDVLKTMRTLQQSSQDAFDNSHPVEALKHLVGILALDEQTPPETDRDRSAERTELVRAANAHLLEIGARLKLEPTDNWLKDGTQKAGDLHELTRGSGMMPSVCLVANYDFGKSVVADAPIRFAFIDGLGELAPLCQTDSSGIASTTVRRITSGGDKGVLIRAVLSISNGGKTRIFPEVSRDFSYVAAVRSARLYALERPSSSSGSPSVGHSPLVDALARGLASSGLDLLPTDASLDPASFGLALSGDQKAVTAALQKGGSKASYLVLALTEYDPPRQQVFQGKAYEIYTTTARVQVRFVRADGSILLSRAPLQVSVRAGNPDASIQAALAQARKAVEADLSNAGPEIKSALAN